MTRALQVEALRAGYGPVEILGGIDLGLNRGETLAVLGRNGAGKTTLVKTIMGILPPHGGTVAVLGEDVTGRGAHHVARAGVAYVPQEAGLFDDLTVEDNFRIVLPKAASFTSALQRSFSLFPVLADRLSQRAGTLSGGQRKLLMAARMLVQQADIIVLDEISEGVQPSNLRQIQMALKEELVRGASVLLIEQKLNFALEIATHFAVLKTGNIVAEGQVKPETASQVTTHLVL